MKKPMPKFKYKIGDVVQNEKYQCKILDRKYEQKFDNQFIRNIKLYNCQCARCGYSYWRDERRLNLGCKVCANKLVVKGINDVGTTHPQIVKYFKNQEDSYKFHYNSRNRVPVICPVCNKYETLTEVHTLCVVGHVPCPKCSDGISYPNKIGYSIFRQLPVENLIREYNFEGSKYHYDFSFFYKKIHYLIEMDGGYHFDQSKEQYDIVKQRDINKDLLALQNKCVLIRIECMKSSIEHIKKNVIKSNLNDIFDLSVINWGLCEEEAKSSVLVEIANYYNNTTKKIKDVAMHFDMNDSTIRTYLKRAAAIQLVDYKTHYQIALETRQKVIQIKKEHPEYNNSKIAKLVNKTCTTITSCLKYGVKNGMLPEV